MNDELLREIQQAQVKAAEDVVVEDLRRKGLLPPATQSNLRQFPSRVGVVVSLDQLQAWAKEYITDMGGDGSNDIAERLTLSGFIAYLRQRLMTTDEKKDSH